MDRYSHILNIQPVKPTKSKELRAGEVAYLINQGSVLLPESAPWLESYKAELSGFPLAPLNDKVDATVHAALYRYLSFRSLRAALDRVAGIAFLREQKAAQEQHDKPQFSHADSSLDNLQRRMVT